MGLLGVILTLVVIGVIMWLVNAYIPMTQPIKTILNVVVVLCIVIWLITLFFPGITHIRVPSVRS